jgi:hypothetical protein
MTSAIPKEKTKIEFMFFYANKFFTRRDLDDYISDWINDDNDPKDALIVGTELELGRLGLSKRSKVWGIKCKVESNVKKKK